MYNRNKIHFITLHISRFVVFVPTCEVVLLAGIVAIVDSSVYLCLVR